MKTPMTVTAVVLNDCNFNCNYCIAGCSRPGADKEKRVDFDALLRWLKTYFPECNLHVSGGEPLLHEGLFDGLKKALDAGHNITLFTNGSFLPSQTELLDLPVLWHMTYHPEQQSFESFLKSANLIKNKPHIICEVYNAERVPSREAAAKKYEGFNFYWIRENCGYIDLGVKPDVMDTGNLRTIGIHGEVYPCGGGSQATVGNIYDMSYDKEKADSFASKMAGCIQGGMCGSYGSAVLCHKVREGI